LQRNAQGEQNKEQKEFSDLVVQEGKTSLPSPVAKGKPVAQAYYVKSSSC
jgi:hypothetical protein